MTIYGQISSDAPKETNRLLFTLKCKCGESLTQHNLCYEHGDTGEEFHLHAGGYHGTVYRCKEHGVQNPFHVSVEMCMCAKCQSVRDEVKQAALDYMLYGKRPNTQTGDK